MGPMDEKRAGAIEQAAYRKLQEVLRPKLMALKTKEDVTAEKLEALVNETVRQVGAQTLAELFELEPWLGDAAQASAWVCPSCGRGAPRAVDAAGNPLFEDGPLHTTQGQVRWRAPLFECAGCRRRFSPLTTLL